MIDIPSEEDFNALPDMKSEAQDNNEANRLAPRAPTKFSDARECELWVKAKSIELRQMSFTQQVRDWEDEHERHLQVLYDHHRAWFDQMDEELDNAKFNTHSVRF